MQRVDGSLDTLDDLIGILGDEFGHIFEGESDGIDALDDPVVEILADALALIEDGEPMDLLVEAGVLDRDRRVPGEGLHEVLVGRRELVRAVLVRQVQVADRSTLYVDGHAQGSSSSADDSAGNHSGGGRC